MFIHHTIHKYTDSVVENIKTASYREGAKRELLSLLGEVYSDECKHTDEEKAARYTTELLGTPETLATRLDKSVRSFYGMPAIIVFGALAVICNIMSSVMGMFNQSGPMYYLVCLGLVPIFAVVWCWIYEHGFKVRNIVNGLRVGSLAAGLGVGFQRGYYVTRYYVTRNQTYLGGNPKLIETGSVFTVLPFLAIGFTLFVILTIIRRPIVKAVKEREVIAKMIHKAQKRSMFM